MGKVLILIFLNSIQVQSDSVRLVSMHKEIRSLSRSNTLEAIKKAETRLSLSIQSNNPSEIIESENLLGGLYRILLDSGNSVIHYKKAIEYSIQYNQKGRIPQFYDFIGRVYRETNSPSGAMDNHLKALEMRQQLNDSSGIAKSYNYLGIIYSQVGLHKKALEYFSSAYNINRKLYNLSQKANDKNQSRLSIISVINSLSELNELDSAYSLIKLIPELIDSTKTSQILTTNLILGKNHLDRANHDAARAVLLNNLTNEENIKPKSKPIILKTLNNLGYLELELENYNLSQIYLLKAEELVGQNTELKTLSRLYSNLHSLSSKVGDWSESKGPYRYLVLVDSIDDILNSENRINQAYGMELKYETGKKDQQIENLSFKNNAFVIIISLSAVVIVLLILRSVAIKKLERKNKKLYDQEVNQLISSQELKMIQAMIDGQEKERARIAEDLHDRLGSTLSAASMHLDAIEYSSTDDENTVTVRNLLSKAIEDTRQISHNMLSGVLTKFGLIAALNDLKQTIEGANRVTMTLEAEELDINLSREKELHLYRVIQELVSNALKHAYARHLVLSFKKTGLGYQVVFSDDGIGFDSKEVNEGIGLKNVGSRLERIKATHEFKTSESGTTIIINLAA